MFVVLAAPDSKGVCFSFSVARKKWRMARLMNNHDHKTIPCFTVGMGLQYLTILDGIIIYETG